MKLTKQLIGILACILLFGAALVYAGLTYPGFDLKPTDGSVLTSTAVNFSFRINNTDDGDTVFKYELYNRSSTTGTWEKLIRSGNITNASINNHTLITMADGDRHYWRVNFTNVSATNDTTETPIFIFNVDTNYYKFVFGGFKAINFTLNEGNVVLAGNVTALGYKLENQTNALKPGCGRTNDGTFHYNGTLWFCNDSVRWAQVSLGSD